VASEAGQSGRGLVRERGGVPVLVDAQRRAQADLGPLDLARAVSCRREIAGRVSGFCSGLSWRPAASETSGTPYGAPSGIAPEPAISAVMGESCHVEGPRGPVFGLRWRGGGQPLA
jgi:hypothetical protein